MSESAMDFLERVIARARELYALSDQGEWDDLEPWMQASWINAARADLEER